MTNKYKHMSMGRLSYLYIYICICKHTCMIYLALLPRHTLSWNVTAVAFSSSHPPVCTTMIEEAISHAVLRSGLVELA